MGAHTFAIYQGKAERRKKLAQSWFYPPLVLANKSNPSRQAERKEVERGDGRESHDP